MEKKENLEIEKTPEVLTDKDLEKVGGGFPGSCGVICSGLHSSSCTSD